MVFHMGPTWHLTWAQDGSRGTSEVTGFIAAVSGFVLVSLQVLSLVYVYQKEQQEHEATERDHKVAHETEFDNPVATNEDNDQEQKVKEEGK